ncbi:MULTISPECIES: NAD(P)-dependent oxidoreductase [Edwardsiella]|uniref:2-hydroxy-3-oxopropionate reductase n=2 Tax=Edwardsiella anguillarum TaxID=1821960 RepID=A0A076LSF7_9GAMM|nr:MULTISPECIES: NAD(P)-dependent oxidoreductase [Edwardsiella]AKM46158.1 3-hydroxyisobutyrate dehydrogenase [Edwardsiella sp. EA181011]GAJ67181.1 phosphogluconate dehydrogenase, NAD-binding domain protein [Edwardsiella piscicida]AIJ08509.1 2-hydroxy-3-oxopropionate reductase [Edwardsiella anguillarum ET080813]AKR76573.1 NAD(P)-dependent oxidoreductase [Edwardsiella sp. LADL05-105]KAB0593034.1 NAD(P)-dependent oxidoreductase [Edwardsiella anguillarum]
MNTIGFIGLGLMGEAMSKNIVNAFSGNVVVYDLNPEAVNRLVAYGAQAAVSIADVAQQADVIISMVPRSEHVLDVYQQLLPHLHAGQITIDMSTIDPSVSMDISAEVAKTGAVMLDAPVVKSVPAAVKAELGIYVGGDKAAWGKVKPVLAMMGNNQIHMGENGRGLVMKIIHNLMVAGIQNSVNEMLTTADRYGIDKTDFHTAISYGGATNWYLDSKINSLIAEDYRTAFSLQNMAKDVNIMKTLLQESGLTLPGVDVVKAVYDRGIESGLGGEDFCATFKVVKDHSSK